MFEFHFDPPGIVCPERLASWAASNIRLFFGWRERQGWMEARGKLINPGTIGEVSRMCQYLKQDCLWPACHGAYVRLLAVANDVGQFLSYLQRQQYQLDICPNLPTELCSRPILVINRNHYR